jgi:hypothetical protein
LPGKGSDGKANVAVRVLVLHGKALCRALSSLPCAKVCAVRHCVAVRWMLCRARVRCRAANTLPCAHTLPCGCSVPCARFAVRHLARQRALFFSFFLLFFAYSLHFKYSN